MNIIAHCEDDTLVIQATSMKLYVVSANYNPFRTVIKSIHIALLEDGQTTEAAKRRALQMFDKVTEGRAGWGQRGIDITEWYSLMTSEQRKALYAKEG